MDIYSALASQYSKPCAGESYPGTIRNIPQHYLCGLSLSNNLSICLLSNPPPPSAIHTISSSLLMAPTLIFPVNIYILFPSHPPILIAFNIFTVLCPYIHPKSFHLDTPHFPLHSNQPFLSPLLYHSKRTPKSNLPANIIWYIISISLPKFRNNT